MILQNLQTYKTYKNLQKLNNPFKTFSMNIPWVFQFKFHLGFLDTKTWNPLV